MYGEEGIVLKMGRIKQRLSINLLIVCLISFAAGVAFYFVSVHIVENNIEKYVYEKDLRQSEQDKKAKEFQEYLQNNELKISDTDEISEWVRNQKYLYLKIIKDGELVFDSVNSKHKSNAENIDDILINTSSVNSTYNTQISDETVDVVIYCFTEFRMLNLVKIILLLISIGIFLAIVGIFTALKVRYISKLSSELAYLAEVNLNGNITLKGNDEIRKLAEIMDYLRISVIEKMENEKKAYKKNRELIISLSHDLRTPLTSIIGYLELLDKKTISYDSEGQYIKRILEQAYRLKEMADSILNYSVGKMPDIVKENANANELIMQVVEDPLIELEMQGVEVQREISDISCLINVNISLIKRVFENIFSNIKKYADLTKPIKVKYGIKNEKLFVELYNEKTGSLMPGGNGIGLKNIKEIVRNHGGKSIYKDKSDSFKIYVELPIVKNAITKI